MPKGKKFNAAEKHFEQEKREWIRKIKEVEYKNRKLISENYDLLELVQCIEEENNKLREVNEELMKIKDMRNSDIKILISSRKSALQFKSIFDHMCDYI